MAGAIYNDLTGFGTINSSAFEVGIAFHVSEAVTVDGLQWYRAATGAGMAPEIVRLWRVSDTSELGRLTSVPDSGAVGWQHAALATPIDIVAGEVYVVAGYFPGAGGQPSTTAPGTLSPALTITLESSFRRYRSGSAGYPSNADAGSYIAMDVTGALAGGGGGDDTPLTLGNLAAGLAEWLSTDVDAQTHEEDGLPWLTKAALDDATNGLAAIKGAINAVSTKIGSATGLDFSTLFAGLAELWTRTATLLDRTATLIERVPTTIAASFASILGHLAGTSGSATGALSGRTAFPTELWTLIDEVDFVQAKSWDVAADLYTLSTSDWPVNVRQLLVDGAPWRPRLGWWAVRNGDLLGARRFVDWEASILEDGGRRMPGIVVWLEPSTAGTLQAWRLT